MTEPALATAESAGGFPSQPSRLRRIWSRRSRRVLLVMLVVAAVVGGYFIARSVCEPRFRDGGFGQSGPGRPDTPYTFAIPIELDRMPLATQLTGVSARGLPPGLHASVAMMRPGDYTLNVMGFAGDPTEHHASQLVPIRGYDLHAGSSRYANLLLTLRADAPGQYTMHGLRVGWRAGPFWGTHVEDFTITLRISGNGPDPALNDPSNPLTTSDGSIYGHERRANRDGGSAGAER